MICPLRLRLPTVWRIREGRELVAKDVLAESPKRANRIKQLIALAAPELLEIEPRPHSLCLA